MTLPLVAMQPRVTCMQAAMLVAAATLQTHSADNCHPPTCISICWCPAGPGVGCHLHPYRARIAILTACTH